MRVREIMKRNVVSVHEDITLGEAATLLVEKHIGSLPIVDNHNRLMGMLGIADILEL